MIQSEPPLLQPHPLVERGRLKGSDWFGHTIGFHPVSVSRDHLLVLNVHRLLSLTVNLDSRETKSKLLGLFLGANLSFKLAHRRKCCGQQHYSTWSLCMPIFPGSNQFFPVLLICYAWSEYFHTLKSYGWYPQINRINCNLVNIDQLITSQMPLRKGKGFYVIWPYKCTFFPKNMAFDGSFTKVQAV